MKLMRGIKRAKIQAVFRKKKTTKINNFIKELNLETVIMTPSMTLRKSLNKFNTIPPSTLQTIFYDITEITQKFQYNTKFNFTNHLY